MKFESLYSFIEDNFGARNQGKEPLHLVRRFCETYSLDFDRMKKIVYDFGGHDDVEVILNVPNSIPGDCEIDLNIETPVEFAERNNLYCKMQDGKWVECEKSDPCAMLDLNRAHIFMGESNERRSYC